VRGLIDKAAPGTTIDEAKAHSQFVKQADKYLRDIEATLKPSVVRPALWVFQKIWQKVYD
jgi:hypothetical protein